MGLHSLKKDNSLQSIERSLLPQSKVYSTTNIQLLEWLHVKQEQHKITEKISYSFQYNRTGVEKCPEIRILQTDAKKVKRRFLVNMTYDSLGLGTTHSPLCSVCTV